MTLAMRHADYGQRWGEGAARYFYIEGDFLDENLGLRLMPVPDGFFCPISAAIMADPVSTVDGCAYEREYIERWFRERRQQRQTITSPATGLELLSTTLMPLVALQRAIEAYLAHRPELKQNLQAGRSYEEAAQALQADLLEKQAMNASVHDEMRRLREANRALRRALERSEERYAKVLDELLQLKATASLTNPGAADAGGKEKTDLVVKPSAQGKTAAEGPIAASVPGADRASEKDGECNVEGRQSSLGAVADTSAEVKEQPAKMQPVPITDATASDPGAEVVTSGKASPPSQDAVASDGGMVTASAVSSANAPVAAAELVVARTSESAIGASRVFGSEQLPNDPTKVAKTATVIASRELKGCSAATLEAPARGAPASAAEAREIARRDPANVAQVVISSTSKKHDGLAAGAHTNIARRPSASVPRAETSGSPKTNENSRVASREASSNKVPASVARADASSTSLKTEEQKKEAEHSLRSRDSERIHSSLQNSSCAGVVVRPSCLPVPLSSDEERTSCSSSDESSITGSRSADRSASAIWSWVVLLVIVCIITISLQLQLVNPDFGRTKQVQDIFGVPALLSVFVERQTATTGHDHSVTTDMRNDKPLMTSSVAASPTGATSLESTSSQEVEETRGGAPSDVDEQALLIEKHVERLRSGNLDEKVRSAAALEALALKGPAEQAAIARRGTVRLLVELVRSEGRQEVRGMGAAALGAVVAGSSENQLIAWRAGAISTIVKLLKASIAPKIAAATLRNLATNNAKNQVAIVRAGAIPQLVDLMTDGAPEARLEAAAALEELAGERSATKLYDKQVAFVHAGAIPPLVRLLPDKAGGVRRASASMLRMLATHNADNQVAIAQAGAILPLVTLLTDTEAEVRKEAAAALGRLSIFETEANFGNQAGIGQAGAIPLLVALLEDPSPDVPAIAAGTLRNLATSNAENQIRMLNAGVTRPLVSMLKSDDKTVQAAAMRLVGSLADNSAENQLAMARAGVLKRLLQLMKVPQSRGEAGRALASLARNSVENQVTIKQAGVNLEPHVGDSP